MFVGIQKNAYSAAIEKAAKYHYFAAFRAVKTANLVRAAGFEPTVSWSQRRVENYAYFIRYF